MCAMQIFLHAAGKWHVYHGPTCIALLTRPPAQLASHHSGPGCIFGILCYIALVAALSYLYTKSRSTFRRRADLEMQSQNTMNGQR